MMTFIVIVVLVTVVLYQNVYGLDELNADTYQQLSYATDASTAGPLRIKAIADNRDHWPTSGGTGVGVVAGAGASASVNGVSDKRSTNANNHNHIDTVTDYLLKRQHKTYESSVTGTPKPAITTLDDIFITVKTTKLYHNTRLALIIKTWFQLAKEQVSKRKRMHFFALLFIDSSFLVGRHIRADCVRG